MTEIKQFNLDLDKFMNDFVPRSDEEIDNYYKQQEEYQKQRAFENLVPPRYWSTSLESYTVTTAKQQEALAVVSSYIKELKDGSNKSLVLLGKAGTGKTHLAIASIREYHGMYKNIYEIIQEYHQARGYSSKETESQVINRYGSYEYLVIDEIGRGFNPEEEKFILYQIINTRYNYNLPTLLVSNKNSNDFLQFVGDAVRDRLLEIGHIFDFGDTPTYRLNKRGASNE